MNVGFIGLGHMGEPMSGNVLAAGHDLVVHDVRRDAAAGLEAAGARWAASPRETGVGRDVVITMLPRPEDVERVLLGPDGLLSEMSPGAIWMDMSTSIPAASCTSAATAPVTRAVGAGARRLRRFLRLGPGLLGSGPRG